MWYFLVWQDITCTCISCSASLYEIYVTWLSFFIHCHCHSNFWHLEHILWYYPRQHPIINNIMGCCPRWMSQIRIDDESKLACYCLVPLGNRGRLNIKVSSYTWWRHQMETFSALLALCVGNSPVTGEFLSQRPVTRSCDVFFDLRLNKRLRKQSRRWWFKTP